MNNEDILDFEFMPGDFADVIAYDGEGEDVSITVRIDGSYYNNNSKYYHIFGPAEDLLAAGYQIYDINGGWAKAVTLADELEPSDKTGFIKII